MIISIKSLEGVSRINVVYQPYRGHLIWKSYLIQGDVIFTQLIAQCCAENMSFIALVIHDRRWYDIVENIITACMSCHRYDQHQRNQSMNKNTTTQ